MSTPQVVRIVVRGWTYTEGQLDNCSEARAMLLDAFASDRWPSGRADFTVTPGGFIRSSLPYTYKGGRGWCSKTSDLDKLIPYAEPAVAAVVRGAVLKKAKRRTSYLTLGVDLNRDRHKEDRIRDGHSCGRHCPESCTHAELVAVLDTKSGKVVRWTGKSHPTTGQQHTLIHVKDLATHLLKIGSKRVLVLGCHDLHLFSGRGTPSINGPTHKEKRSRRMHKLARKSKPTIVLHHPHTTYSPRIWRGPWRSLRSILPTVQLWASGIAFCGNPEPPCRWKPWQALEATCSATASENGVHDVVIEGYDR